MGTNLKDLSGERFGKLIAIKVADTRRGHPYWLCRCDCGRDVLVRGSELRVGKTRSCGKAGCKHRKTTVTRRTTVIKEVKTMEAKKDCFAYLARQGGETCTALNRVYCKTEECKYYAPLKKVCRGCEGNCGKCLTVSHQKQMEGKK